MALTDFRLAYAGPATMTGRIIIIIMLTGAMEKMPRTVREVDIEVSVSSLA
jgi:hypothetical protein